MITERDKTSMTRNKITQKRCRKTHKMTTRHMEQSQRNTKQLNTDASRTQRFSFSRGVGMSVPRGSFSHSPSMLIVDLSAPSSVNTAA